MSEEEKAGIVISNDMLRAMAEEGMAMILVRADAIRIVGKADLDES